MHILKNLFGLIAILLLFSFSSGCEKKQESSNPYQLMNSDDGRLYRLNKKTGHIVILEGNKIIPLEVERRTKAIPDKPEVVVDTPDLKQDVTPLQVNPPEIIKTEKHVKHWDDEQLRGKNLKVSFESSWLDNKFSYVLEAHPYSSLKKMLDKKESDVYYQHKWHGFVIKLIDQNEQTVKIVPVKLWDMSKTLDDQGKFLSLKTDSQIELLEDEFIRITGYKVDWKLDRILIPDYKFKNKVDDLIQTYSWYGEVNRKVDKLAPHGAKYWWITFPDKKKIYFSTEEELLNNYKLTIEKIVEGN